MKVLPISKECKNYSEEIYKTHSSILYILYIALWRSSRVVNFLKIISFTDNV